MLVFLGLVIMFIIMLLCIRKENLDDKNTDKAVNTVSKVSTDKTDQPTIIVVNNPTDPPHLRFADPFYTMTDPYWSAYNYRPIGFGRRIINHPHRRVW